MKVKELRSWLENLGEKHKQHYRRGISHVPRVKQDENLLSIQTKPSNASTSPMSSSGSIGSEDAVSHSSSCSLPSSGLSDIRRSFRAQPTSSDMAKEDVYYPDPSFVDLSDESSVEDDENFEEFQFRTEKCHPLSNEPEFSPESGKARRVTFGGIQGAGRLYVPVNAKGASKGKETAGINSSLRCPDAVIKVKNPDLPELQQAKSIFRKKTDLAALEFVQTKQGASMENSTRINVRAPRSSVGAAIELFGGQGGRKTIVASRTDELQRLWSESRAVTHVKKTKWCVCEKTGVYKRKIVVEPEHRST